MGKQAIKKIAEKLTPKQELFCKLYASDKEFFGSGVNSYAEAYGIDISKPGSYKTAQVNASRMLSNAMIFNRINDLLDSSGLNDAFVDKQLLAVISQHEDRGSKVAAIREYNKLKARITEKIDHTSKGERIGIPILGELNVHSNDSNQTDSTTDQAD